MYVPKNFKAPSDQDVREIIMQNSFGILIASDLEATHIPMELVTTPDGRSHAGPEIFLMS